MENHRGAGGLNELIYWGVRIQKQYGTGESDYKIEGLHALGEVRAFLAAGEPNWRSEFKKRLRRLNTVHWSCKDRFFKDVMKPHPEMAKAILRELWQGPLDGDYEHWISRLEKPLQWLEPTFPGNGYRLQLLTTLLSVEGPTALFPYKKRIFQKAYEKSGYPSLDRQVSAMDELRHAISFIDRYMEEASRQGVVVEGRLQAHDLIWYALGYETKADWVGWTSEDVEAHQRFTGRKASNLAKQIEALLKQQSKQLSVEEPESFDDGQCRVARQILQRRGQDKFRKRLLKAYKGRCAISGFDAVQALEAAHIVPYCQSGTSKLENGLLLRSDFHTLFDQGLIAINPASWTVSIHPSLKKTTYASFDGQPVMLPDASVDHPSAELLHHHLTMCRF